MLNVVLSKDSYYQIFHDFRIETILIIEVLGIKLNFILQIDIFHQIFDDVFIYLVRILHFCLILILAMKHLLQFFHKEYIFIKNVFITSRESIRKKIQDLPNCFLNKYCLTDLVWWCINDQSIWLSNIRDQQ